MKYLLSLALLPLVCCLVFGEIVIEGDSKVVPYTLVELTAKTTAAAEGIVWKVETKDREKVKFKKVGKSVVFTGPPGKYYVTATTYRLGEDKSSIIPDEAEFTVTIGNPDPGPTPGPGPTPEPQPDKEQYIAGEGFRVLIVYESKDLSKLPPKQLSVLYSKPLRTWLKEACATDKDNPDGAFRIYDKDVDVSAETKSWQSAMQRKRTSLPWIVISNPRVGSYEGALPADSEKTLELLKRYGGK